MKKLTLISLFLIIFSTTVLAAEEKDPYTKYFIGTIIILILIILYLGPKKEKEIDILKEIEKSNINEEAVYVTVETTKEEPKDEPLPDLTPKEEEITPEEKPKVTKKKKKQKSEPEEEKEEE